MIENIGHYLLASTFVGLGLFSLYGLYVMIRWGMGFRMDLKFILFYAGMATICFIVSTVILIDSGS